jgi:DNA polymerase III subunit alpha
MYIVFDTETTGLPEDFSAPITDFNNWPRIVQIAWKVYDLDGKEISSHNRIIKPDGFVIPQDSIKIHRITNERANREGISLKNALDEFVSSINSSNFLIAHNISFDDKVTACEFLRMRMKNHMRNITHVCTMNSTINFCRIQGKMGLKHPTLTELHEKLFDKKFEDAHDALIDVEALAKCFFELKKLKILSFDKHELSLLNSKNSEVSILEKWKNKSKEIEENESMVHFGVHTYHSVLEGAGNVDEYISEAKKYNHKSLVLTDLGTLSGSFSFYKKCKSEDIKPIIGCEFFVNDSIGEYEPKVQDKNVIQKVIIKNHQGFLNINKINYLSFQDGYYRVPRAKTDWILENKEGLILTTSSKSGMISKYLQMGRYLDAEDYLTKMLEEFGKHSYIAEISIEDNPIQRQYNSFIINMANKYSMALIFSNEIYYPKKEDSTIQDVLQSVSQKKSIKKSKTKENRQMYYLNADDIFKMNKDFGFNYDENFLKTCFVTSEKLSSTCKFDFEIDVEKYPNYKPTKDVTEYFKTENAEEIIYKLSHAKLNQKLKIYENNGPVKIDADKIIKYRERLDYELKVIKDKKMLDYFLVVWELIKFCGDNDISVGPGRGSAAGSLLSWVLDITKIDPLRFNLYFERFLNPTRNSPPDIDIDFETGSDVKTDEFLYNKYGKDCVFPVITFSTFNEKGCMKDVAKAFGQDAGFESDVFAVTKEMPKMFMKYEGDLKDWLRDYPNSKECSNRVKNWILDPKNKQIIEVTLRLQGQVRNLGKHAAGIVITPNSVWNSMPINVVKGIRVSGFQESGSGKDLSDLGILKLDRLNLTTLNVLKESINLVKENRGIDILEQVKYVDLHNPDLFEELRGGNNQGIFQFESDGMSKMIKKMNTESFEEMVAANALYRPGPMGLKAHEEYIKNKKYPEDISLVHSCLEPLLKETNGVLIFQEQLMFIAHELGGMSLGEGDNLRKVMDKASKIIKKKLSGEKLESKELKNKSYKQYLELWDKFKQGCKNKGLKDNEVKKIEEWLVKYLGYSFNRSHSVSYSYVAMQTLFMKRYYPTEFYTALLNNAKNDENWLSSAIMGAFLKGIKILPPSRKSKWEWTMLDEENILMGFSSINGMGEIAYDELQKADIENIGKDKFFTNAFSKFNKSNFESCLKAGVFDDWSNSREELKELRKMKMKTNTMQLDLFGKNSFDIVEDSIKGKFEDTTKEERYRQFIDVCSLDLDLFNKISNIKQEFQSQYNFSIESVIDFDKQEKYYFFVLKNIIQKISKNGKNYWSLELGDGGSSVKMVVWEDAYDRIKDKMEIGGIYLTKFSKDRGWLKFQDGAQFRRIY